MDIPKSYRLAYAGLAIELLRPLILDSDYVITGEFDIENFAFLEWTDSRPQPEVAEVQRIVMALKAVEDSFDSVYTEIQAELIANSEEIVE